MNQVWKKVANFAVCKINDDDTILFTSKLKSTFKAMDFKEEFKEKFWMSYLGHILQNILKDLSPFCLLFTHLVKEDLKTRLFLIPDP